MTHPEKREEVETPAGPVLDRRQFLALCAASASALLFGAACGAGEGEEGGENGGNEDQEQNGGNGGGEDEEQNSEDGEDGEEEEDN